MDISINDNGNDNLPNPHYRDPASLPPNPTHITIRDHTPRIYDVTFHSHSIRTLVTSDPSQVDNWISDTLCFPPSFHSQIIGFDVEWRPNTFPDIRNPIATIQLCAEDRCLIFQILHAPCIPRSLVNFLIHPDVMFVGVGIYDDVVKLLEDYRLHVEDCTDLRGFAAEEFREKELKNAGIKTLSLRFLGLEFEKPKRVGRSTWDDVCLTPEQVQYACVDAFVSYQLGNRLIGIEYR